MSILYFLFDTLCFGHNHVAGWHLNKYAAFVPSFVHLSVCSFVRLFVCSFVRLFVCSFVRLFVCSFVRLFVRSFVCSFVRPFLRFHQFSKMSAQPSLASSPPFKPGNSQVEQLLCQWNRFYVIIEAAKCKRNKKCRKNEHHFVEGEIIEDFALHVYR